MRGDMPKAHKGDGMQVIKVDVITVPDNVDRPPGVTPMRPRTFEATLSPEAHAEMLRLIDEADRGSDA